MLNPKTGKTVGIIYSVSEMMIGQKRCNSPGMSRVHDTNPAMYLL